MRKNKVKFILLLLILLFNDLKVCYVCHYDFKSLPRRVSKNFLLYGNYLKQHFTKSKVLEVRISMFLWEVLISTKLNPNLGGRVGRGDRVQGGG